MKYAKPMFAALLAVLAVTILLSVLPNAGLHTRPGKGDVAVFKVTPAIRLTNRNLVDVLISMQLDERLNHTVWSNGVLSVDMSVNPASGRPAAWFADIEKMLRVSFLQLENVKRVLIRIVEERKDGKVLLAAIDVRKTDSWLLYDMDALKNADPIHDTKWRERLRISLTAAWEEHFGRASGFSVKPSTLRESSQ
ncbi:hypothetical protein KP806_05120 [Paenibacillus sp. N4]|uniref:hypothetical protein n=1 Tax=Paenibacillus vietnamensis TaxID=2590547 RepID=UPI001CD0F69F|nr:hypothetical protein [Paenibacillus vietnamensis]MCA0754421.1 hypothetical protein [Paenibacillus vietnamensis]